MNQNLVQDTSIVGEETTGESAFLIELFGFRSKLEEKARESHNASEQTGVLDQNVGCYSHG